MDALWDNRQLVLEGFGQTLALLVVAGLIALALGTVLGSFRVSPVLALRAIGTAYVTCFRNTPLVVLFLLVYFGLPELDVRPSQFWRATIALALYTTAFICEAVRSGINAVPTGQAEAARSVGMGFGQVLRLVVLPQAFRAVVPPIASVLIALAKNTSLVAGFGIADATFRMRGLINDNPGDVYVIFLGIALGYILIVAVISVVARVLERSPARSAS
ncbi:MAG: amino acid ABC transporter permease [Actinomycetota bacterium]|nr:amino acid ABC transporter permease [Actinomycetota bacterium]